MSDLRLWMATPCWRRPEVTRLVLAQRQHLQRTVGKVGIELRCVIVADDENLEIGREFGFDTVEHDNRWLGERWNAGFRYALEQGADFVAAVDSDSWVHPDYLRVGPWDDETIRSGNLYTHVDPTGREIVYSDVSHAWGSLGPMFLPRQVLEKLDGRPIEDQLKRGVSGSIYKKLRAAFPVLRWENVNVHDLQYVGLRSPIGEQITKMQPMGKWEQRRGRDPWKALSARYPADVVAAAKKVYAKRRPAVVPLRPGQTGVRLGRKRYVTR